MARVGVPCCSMADTETAFLHHLVHATLRVAAHALRRTLHLSQAALKVITHRADQLLVSPARDSLNPYPLLRWLFDLPEPPDPRVHQFAFRQDWHSMADVREAMPDFHRWHNHGAIIWPSATPRPGLPSPRWCTFVTPLEVKTGALPIPVLSARVACLPSRQCSIFSPSSYEVDVFRPAYERRLVEYTKS